MAFRLLGGRRGQLFNGPGSDQAASPDLLWVNSCFLTSGTLDIPCNTVIWEKWKCCWDAGSVCSEVGSQPSSVSALPTPSLMLPGAQGCSFLPESCSDLLSPKKKMSLFPATNHPSTDCCLLCWFSPNLLPVYEQTEGPGVALGH